VTINLNWTAEMRLEHQYLRLLSARVVRAKRLRYRSPPGSSVQRRLKGPRRTDLQPGTWRIECTRWAMLGCKLSLAHHCSTRSPNVAAKLRVAQDGDEIGALVIADKRYDADSIPRGYPWSSSDLQHPEPI